MSEIYLHQKGFPDKLLGRVTEDGIVYRSDPDEKNRLR